MRLNGAPVALRGPYDAWENGIALAPRERRAEGLFLDDDIADNISLPHLRRYNRLGLFVDRPANTGAPRRWAERSVCEPPGRDKKCANFRAATSRR